MLGRAHIGILKKRLCAARTVSAKKKGGPLRQGAKQAKKMEKLQSAGRFSDPTEATMFRAISARANYLAQDRPDISVAAMELCGEFSRPTKQSYERLQRLRRYLVGHHRMAYKYELLDCSRIN